MEWAQDLPTEEIICGLDEVDEVDDKEDRKVVIEEIGDIDKLEREVTEYY